MSGGGLVIRGDCLFPESLTFFEVEKPCGSVLGPSPEITFVHGLGRVFLD